MKKFEREKWNALCGIQIPWPGAHKDYRSKSFLCMFCRYTGWDGWSPCDSYLICKHALEAVEKRSDDVWQGADCWGFKPDISWDMAVEWTGQRLQGLDVTMEKAGERDNKNSIEGRRNYGIL